MPPVESSGISAQQPLHDGLDRGAAAPQQQMDVVGDQRSGATNALGFFQHTPETPKELLSIGIVPENLPPLDPPADDVLQRTRCIDARSSWHVSSHIAGHYQNKVIFSAPFFFPFLSFFSFFQGLLTACRQRQLVAFERQVKTDQFQYILFAVDDQNAFFSHVGSVL